MSKPSKISEQLRQAIAAADITQGELSRRVGLNKSTMSRFMHGQSAVSLKYVDAICVELGLNLVDSKPRKQR